MAYKWKKTASKALWALAEVLVAGALVYLTDNGLYLAVIPLLEAARNWLKHRK